MEPKPQSLVLPLSIITKGDINRLIRELEKFDEAFIVQRTSETDMPQPTASLHSLFAENTLELSDKNARLRLKAALEQMVLKAPVLHISFATEPPPRALDQILNWFRQNIHPQCLLQVGLQPTIAAGCVLRTPNKVFDMSLRSFLKDHEKTLVELIHASGQKAALQEANNAGR